MSTPGTWYQVPGDTTMSSTTPVHLSDRYYRRLKLDPSILDTNATLEKLAIITEAHSSEITFDNLAQHGVRGGKACLDVETTAQKILEQSRGGFCFELNGLLGEFLSELGYRVRRIPAYVFEPEICSYRDNSSHLILLVTMQCDDSIWFVDVAFGEPAIHPLQYIFNKPQETPEGMLSRLVHDTDSFVALQWLKDGEWKDRLRWKVDAICLDPLLCEFQKNLEFVQCEESIFSQKLIVCKVTRTKKLTVAGNRLKVTEPRFGPESKQIIEEIDSVDSLRDVLEKKFGIAMEFTEGLDLAKSLRASTKVWSAI